MKHLLPVLLIALSLNFSVSASVVNSENTKDYILIINPDAETCAWGETLIPTVSKELTAKYPDLDVKIEYMYALGITDEEGINNFKEYLFGKYQKSPKYLMLFETDAYAILQEDIDIHWGDDISTLVVAREAFIGPLSYYLDRKAIPEHDRTYLDKVAESRDNIYVVYDLFDIPGTIDIMKNMYPDMHNLVFITDNRYISAENRKEVVEAVVTKYPNVTVENLTPDNLTTDQLIQRFQSMPEGSGFLYFTWFNNELTGEKDLILQTNAYRIFSLYVNYPVFTINDVGLKESGMLGGSYTRFDQVKETVTKTMDDIIAGRSISHNISVPKPVPTFNYLAMQNHNISLSDVPSNSYLYHRPLTFLEKNKDLILGLAVILFLSIICSRIILLIKTRKMQDKEIKLLERYSDLVNNMPIGYEQEQLIFNEIGEPVDYIVTEVNSTFEKLITPSEDIIGRKGSEVNLELVSELSSIYKMFLEGKTKRVTMPYYHKVTDRFFNIIITSSGKYGNIDLFFTDATELYKTQQLLRTANNKLSMSLDIANITPWKWDVESRSMTYEDNKPIETYLDGSEKEETKDESIILTEEEYFSLIHKDDRKRVKQAFLDLLDGKTDKAKEEYRIRFTPESLNFDWVEAQAVVEKRDKEGKPLSVVGSSLTITERKRIEEELLRAKEKAEESNRLKSAFLANMSHEIRTPLNAIVGFSNILATTEKEEEKMEYINIIENNNTLLLQLVSDILDLSKLEAGTMEANYTDVDMNRVMQEQVESVQEKAAPGVQIILEQHPDECHVKVEKIRLLQVLTNLLMNAAKFTTKGEIRFGYTVQDEQMLRFHVTDTGKGIARDQVDKIFGRFVKLDTFKQGTGLGLSLCRAIVDNFGGEIGVDSEEGKGSTFWFTFPYAKTAVKMNAKTAVKTNEGKSKPVILIAEDIPSNFELFEVILKNDYDIVHAWDGKEAVDLFKEKNPLLILMDINMPKLNGYEATMEIRKLSRDVPIIAVTAYAFSTDENQIKKNGFSAYTPKPLNAQNLKNQITELLERTS